MIVHNGKIVTVDADFSIHAAMAIRNGRIIKVGDVEELRSFAGSATEWVDLEGRTVLPGLIDSHVHPRAAMTEFDHRIPEMDSIEHVLSYIRSRAEALEDGDWIFLRQVFITRLEEQRYPTRDELDRVAPNNPVNFATGPEAMLNTAALNRLGIDRNFRVSDGGAGQIERDPATGEPTGLLRGLHRLIEMDLPGREPTEEDYHERLLEMFRDFNSVGLTAVSDRGAYPEYIERFERMHQQGELPVRMALMYRLLSREPADLEQTLDRIREVADHPLHRDDPWLKILGIKVSLDGGMLTGSAYMREPWGVSNIYGISDPEYRGVLSIPPDQLQALARTTFESGLQFTAHSVGDGAVHTVLNAYKEINETLPLREHRPSVTHSNFMSPESIEMAAELGAVLDIQPAWLYLDTRTLVDQFGYDRMRYFQPLRTLFERGVIAGGGTDHMQKIGSLRSVNPYNPFLGMWTTITRQARRYEGSLHPEERLSREQAIRFYTANNAYLLHWEDEIGSLEPEKRADFIILDRDILTCPEDQIKDIQVLQTYIDGKLVYERP